MDGGVPCCSPQIALCDHCFDLLNTCNPACNDPFATWYRHQQGDNQFETARYKAYEKGNPIISRFMTYIARYTPAPDENALLKHIDGAGKVDGSVVVALPIDRWTSTEEVNSYEGHGGGLTFWDVIKVTESGKKETDEIYYETWSGDVAFIDKGV